METGSEKETEIKKEDSPNKGKEGENKIEKAANSVPKEETKESKSTEGSNNEEGKYVKAIPKEETKESNLISLLKLIAPGTRLREAVDDIVKARDGALIVIEVPNLMSIVEGGFKVNCRFTAQRLVELSKMDGAIILSQDRERILYANALLSPDISIHTQETGTRHKAAQRTARQFNTLTIAVSERKRTITIYYENLRHVLSSSADILRNTVESLQILEKQCEIFEEIVLRLNILEFTNLATLSDIAEIIQRGEIIQKITAVINRNLAELGKQGILIRMRLRQLIKDIEKEESFIVEDYSRLKPKKTKALLLILSFEELLEIKNIYTALGYNEGDKIETRGYRILSKLKLEENVIKKIIKNYINLKQLIESPAQKLKNVLKDESKAKKIQKDLSDLKEQALLEKKI